MINMDMDTKSSDTESSDTESSDIESSVKRRGAQSTANKTKRKKKKKSVKNVVKAAPGSKIGKSITYRADNVRDRKSANPNLEPITGVNTMLEIEGTPSLTWRTDEARAEHDKKWRAIWNKAHLTEDEVSEVTSIVEPCNYGEIAELSELLGEMRFEQGSSGRGKMVGGNPTTHFLKLQRWLTAKLARGAAAISDCAIWFINKILDGLTVIGGKTVAGANIAFFASMDLARTALGHNDTQTFQYILAFCGMITSNTYAAGYTVYDWLQSAGAAAAAAAAAAATATGAAFSDVVKPYTDVFTQNMINLLTTQKELFVGKIPGVNTPAQFDAWLKTLTMGDFMTATANIIAAGKWAPVAIAGGQIAGGLVLTTGYYGILAAAWISQSYILTGTWLTYQVYTGLPVTEKESITEAFKAVDEYLANRIIDSTTTQDFMDKIYHLKQDPIAKALVVARLKGEMTEAKVKQNEALGERAHVSRVKALTTALGDITAETTAIEQDTRNRQMHIDIQTAMGKAKKTNGAATRKGADAHPIVKSNTLIAKGNTNININTDDSQTAAAGGGPGATPGAQQKVDAQSLGFGTPGAASSGFAPGAQQKMEQPLGVGTPGGKRATRKRGKRSSKRAPRKTKTTRKKRRGKK